MLEIHKSQKKDLGLFKWNDNFFNFFGYYYFSNNCNTQTICIIYPKGHRPNLPYPKMRNNDFRKIKNRSKNMGNGRVPKTTYN